ncbi:unnamed protein product [Ixodes hexagonus]
MTARVFWSQLLISILVSETWAFKAAVYEHVQQGNPFNETREAVVGKNLAAYTEAAKKAADEQVDIIVFPEGGIMFSFAKWDDVNKTAEDVPDAGAVPCVDKKANMPVLTNLSCLAKENQIYVVANLVDKKPCKHGPCPEHNTTFYNTNVAFDRNGTLISRQPCRCRHRYHMNHVSAAPFMSDADPPEFAVFETDFGERVGMFICFDVLFGEASELVTRHNVTLAVTSTWWLDELPGLYAVAVQQAWSLRHAVPLLAANIQKPQVGSLGSGIYAGIRGPLNYTYSPDGLPKLLVASIDETPNNSRYSGDVVRPDKLHYLNRDNRRYISVALWNPVGKYRACHGDFCCTLRYRTSQILDNLFLFAFDGYDRFEKFSDLRVQRCIVAVCEEPGVNECNKFSTKSRTKFTEFQLEAQFRTAEVFPLLASNELELTPKRHWMFETTSANVSALTMNKGNPSGEPLLQATLFARLYEDRKL